MTNEIRHFHDTDMKCSAVLVSWVTINKINNDLDDFLKYYGNYMDDDSTTVYALFGCDTLHYCVQITK